ncbi:hypothetical protein EYV94_19595 [Puteibacter caeruleilacunae]|nr:hypothetical protein EYV94_19595 [Puteibacter caeruleilacunae]
MDSKSLKEYMLKPGKLDEHTLIQLKEMISDYPWFQSIHMLYLKNLHQIDHPGFQNQLNSSALHVANRTELYNYLQDKPDALLENKINSIKEQTQQVFEMLMDEPEETSPAAFELEYAAAAYTFDDPSIPKEDNLSELARNINHKSEEVQSKQHGELSSSLAKATHELHPEEENSDANTSQQSTSLSDALITETLAKIYIKQGYHKKAIEAFQKLSLKFPEKNTYFAQLIEETKELMNK